MGAASLIGAAITAGATLWGGHQARKAQRSAAAEQQRIANAAVAQSTGSAAAEQVETEAAADDATRRAARRRMTVAGTVNRIGAQGGRITLN